MPALDAPAPRRLRQPAKIRIKFRASHGCHIRLSSAPSFRKQRNELLHDVRPLVFEWYLVVRVA